jgi:hypothetical protein
MASEMPGSLDFSMLLSEFDGGGDESGVIMLESACDVLVDMSNRLNCIYISCFLVECMI